jgi:hypothetical protein
MVLKDGMLPERVRRTDSEAAVREAQVARLRPLREGLGLARSLARQECPPFDCAAAHLPERNRSRDDRREPLAAVMKYRGI